MQEVLTLIALTLLPFLELRASIPYGIIRTDLHWSVVFLICVVTNALLGPLIYSLLDRVVRLLTRIRFIRRLYDAYILRTQKRVSGYVERYGELGIALFIGVPLPGSGSYSGALASYVLGLRFRKFVIANLIGVLIAGAAVLAVTMTGSGLYNLFAKPV